MSLFTSRTAGEGLLKHHMTLLLVTGLHTGWTSFWRVMGPRPDNKTIDLPLWQDPPWAFFALAWFFLVVVCVTVYDVIESRRDEL